MEVPAKEDRQRGKSRTLRRPLLVNDRSRKLLEHHRRK